MFTFLPFMLLPFEAGEVVLWAFFSLSAGSDFTILCPLLASDNLLESPFVEWLCPFSACPFAACPLLEWRLASLLAAMDSSV